MRQGCPLCQILFHTVPKLLAEAIKQEKETEGRQIRKQFKLSLFAKDMILYIRNSKKNARKKSRNKINNVAGYRINLPKKSTAFCVLPTNIQKRRSWEHPHSNSAKKIKYLQINLTKEVKDLYNENFQPL